MQRDRCRGIVPKIECSMVIGLFSTDEKYGMLEKGITKEMEIAFWKRLRATRLMG